MKPFAPMLSDTLKNIDDVKYPVRVSPKLDGIRCIIRNGIAVSRYLKPIPNLFVQEQLKGLPDGLDGELIVGEPNAADVFTKTSSGIKSRDGEPNFTYWVFDYVDDDMVAAGHGFTTRYNIARSYITNHPVCMIVPHHDIKDREALEATEQYYVDDGYEGVMLRDPHGLYKYGRSTLKERGLLKLKRWFDMEATVIDFVERMANNNEATTDALGHTKRSSHKANKTGRGDLGALVCELPNGVKFEIGTGFTDAQRAEIWANQKKYLGQQVTFKYQMLSADGVPRFPVFLRWREEV